MRLDSIFKDFFVMASPVIVAAGIYGCGSGGTAGLGFAGASLAVTAVVMRNVLVQNPTLRKCRGLLVRGYVVAGAATALFGLLGPTILGTERGDPAIAGLIKKLESCPESRKLWHELQRREGPVSVVIGSREEAPTGAARNLEHRTIVLSNTMSEDAQLALLLDQVCEWLEGADLFKVTELGYKGKLSKMETLRMAVEPGFKSSQTHHSVVTACVRSQGWNPGIDLYKGTYMLEPETAWPKFLADPLQAVTREAYYVEWNELFKEAFCSKNPTHADCRT